MTSPVELTVATTVFLLAQVTTRPVSTLPAESLVVASSCNVWAIPTGAMAGVTVTTATGAGDDTAFGPPLQEQAPSISAPAQDGQLGTRFTCVLSIVCRVAIETRSPWRLAGTHLDLAAAKRAAPGGSTRNGNGEGVAAAGGAAVSHVGDEGAGQPAVRAGAGDDG